MDDKKINSYLILLLTVIIAGVVVAAAGRWIALRNGADAGSANLIFVIILGIAAVVYLTLITTLSHLLASWLTKLQSKRKPTVAIPKNTPELKPVEELPTLIPIGEIKRDAEARQIERTAEQIRIFHEYTHYAVGPYVAAESLSRLCKYIELYAHGEEMPKGIVPIRTEKLSNFDLFHFGWNMAEHFNVGKKYEVVPWLQRVFINLRDLESSYIKGKLFTSQTKRYIIPNTDNIAKELARLKG